MSMTKLNNPLYTRSTFNKQDKEFRIGAVVSDGMWYSITKWRKVAKVTEEELNEWIERNLANGRLVQSETGSKSYRFPLESIKKWYEENDLEVGDQILDFVFPARIWDYQTETEGFLSAPLRKIGLVSFSCSRKVYAEVKEALKGIARIREDEPGKYKAYSLNAAYTKRIVENIFKTHTEAETGKIYSRSMAKRREIVDFSPLFREGLVSFYRDFGKSLVKGSMDTIKIYLPDPSDQETQIILWVITAIEKFDESASVPFSGYLATVLKRWPYDLPNIHLGNDLSKFQRNKSKAIAELRNNNPDENDTFSNSEIADKMGMDIDEYNTLEEKNVAWTKSRQATSLTWDENSDEKMSENFSGNLARETVTENDIILATRLSQAIIDAALSTNQYESAFNLISQMDSHELNPEVIATLDRGFVAELGYQLGLKAGDNNDNNNDNNNDDD